MGATARAQDRALPQPAPATPPPTTREDVANAYRLLLGRDAESENVLAERVGADWEDVLHGLLASTEFSERILDPLLLRSPPPSRLGRPVDAGLAAWIDARFAVSLLAGARLCDALGAVLSSLAHRAPDPDYAKVWRFAASQLSALVIADQPPPDEPAEAARRLVDALALPTSDFTPARRRVLLILSDASPSNAGAAGLALARGLSLRRDVIVILSEGGALASALAEEAAAVIGPVDRALRRDGAAMARLGRRLIDTYDPVYVVVAGVQSSAVALGLHAQRAPLLGLLHDLAEAEPNADSRPLLHACDALIFPSAAVCASWEGAYHEIKLQRRRWLAADEADLHAYGGHVDAMGCAAELRVRNVRRDEALLEPADAFDQRLCFGGRLDDAPRHDAIRIYLDQSRPIDFSGPPVWRTAVRRPIPGFHPLAYARLAPDFPADGARNPLAHFLASGRPAGPWTHPILHLPEAAGARPPSTRLKTAVHGHFHYTDNVADFLAALSSNASSIDLFLTTTSQDGAEDLRTSSRDFAMGGVHIEVVANHGRDIAPFVRMLSGRLLDAYEVVGHFHGKRSAHAAAHDAEAGARWRDFLWRRLIGPDHSVADIVLDAFQADAGLGMVFPENDVTMGWELNLEPAQRLAPRLGLGELPEHVEFPVGTMFWARTAALRPLVAAGLGAADFPPEPVAVDGTTLHAIERLLPLVVQKAGYTYAATYDPQVLR